VIRDHGVGSEKRGKTMKKIEWSPTFELGVEEIDNDHRRLFELAQEIYEAVEKVDVDLCHIRTEDLMEALKTHFAREEEFLERAGYPSRDEHKGFHTSLLNKAEKLKNVCIDGGGRKMIEECYMETMTFLFDEIIRGDAKFKSHVKRHLLGQ
jgi:hemerythrin